MRTLDKTPGLMTAKFPGTCKACGLRFAVGAAIVWSKATGARHAFGCEAAKAAAAVAAPVAPTVHVGEFAGVIALFKTAGAHLKFPKITLLVAGQIVKLSVAGARSKAPGTVNVMGEGTYPNRAWFGRVSADGVWTPASSTAPAMVAALAAVLTDLAKDPAAVAKAHGTLTGHCCFCTKKLTDDGSIEVGYGGTCAKHWDLPHTYRGTKTYLQDVVAA